MSRTTLQFMVILLFISGRLCEESLYTMIGTDYQFKPAYIVANLSGQSPIQCAVQCSMLEAGCATFSVDGSGRCYLSDLRQTAVMSLSDLFDFEAGVKTYEKTVDADHPSAVDAVLDTGSSTYFLVDQSRTWYEALDACPLFGGGVHMAVVETDAEQVALRDWLTTVATRDVWLGASDEAHEDCWVWAVPGLPEITYTAWDTGVGEPNNMYGSNPENCLVMKPSKQCIWYDVRCYTGRAVLCERRGRDPIMGAAPSLQEFHDAVCVV